MGIACTIRTSWTGMQFPVSPSLFFSTRGSSRVPFSLNRSNSFLRQFASADDCIIGNLAWHLTIIRNTSNRGVTVVISDKYNVTMLERYSYESPSRRKKSRIFKQKFARNISTNINNFINNDY